MIKKVAWFLVFGLILTNVFGCAKVADSGGSGQQNVTTVTGTLPAGTTSVALGASNISATGNSMSLAVSALNQSSTAVTGLGGGNFTAAVFGANPNISSVTGQTTQSAFATMTWTVVYSGSSQKDVNVALVLDKSGSMWTDKLVSSEVAALKFLDLMSAWTGNKAAVINFDSTVNVDAAMQNVASNLNVLKVAATNEAYGGSTAVYYATAKGIWEASKEAASLNKVRAVIAMTDGGENASPVPYNGIATGTVEVVNQAIACGIPVYTIGLFTSTAEALSYGPYLRSIALGTTGSADNYFEIITGVTGLAIQQVMASGVLENLYAKLAQALSQSYSMTATLSTSLTAGQTYWVQVTFTGQVQGGGTITSTAVMAFVAQ